MKTLGNIIWIVFGGLFWCICNLLIGLIACITIIGIPIGMQYFKLAGFVLWPFGKEVTAQKTSGFKTVLNVIWAIFFGWEIALSFLLTGVIFCITILGIPFGLQYFKMARFVFFPLGYNFSK